MKAAVLYEVNNPLVIEDILLQPPKEGEVLVKLSASGVCHSDLHVITGDLKRPLPMVLGHEGAGIVEEVGEGVKHLKPGDHVLLSFVTPCGYCAYCRMDKSHLCSLAAENRFKGTMFDGTTRLSKNGKSISHFLGLSTFAEYTIVGAAAAIPIRKDFPLDKAALVGCGVMTGVGAVINTAQLKAGSSAVVIGMGGVGLNVIQGCRLAGAEKIIAVDLLDEKLEMAKSFGATDTINSKENDPVEAVKEITEGVGADYAFEVIGNPDTILQAYSSLRKGGKAVIVGIASPEVMVKIPLYTFPSEEKILMGSWYGSANAKHDFPIMIDLIAAGKLNVDSLISQVIPLEEINNAFDLIKKGTVARSLIAY